MTDFDLLTIMPENGRWRRQAFPVPIVVAILRRTTAGESQFLLIRRKAETYGGQWALVGGKWDFGETLATAVTREVQEETSLETRFVALRGVVSERVHPPTDEFPGAHFLILVCDLVVVNGEATEQEEGAVAWFTLEEIEAIHRENGIIPSDYAMLHQFAPQSGGVAHFEAEMIAVIGDRQEHLTELVRFERG
jgi:ADP-ribose pyrophosphatase YjhB (NUDIX family)